MAGLVTAIRGVLSWFTKDMNARYKAGHDEFFKESFKWQMRKTP